MFSAKTAAANVPDTSAGRPTARHTILSVGDLDTNRYRARVLRAAGFSVMEAANGMDALRLAALEQPSLVLLDVRLPDIDGFEVCRRLKSDPKTASVPVIHISALGPYKDDMPHAVACQSDSYLREPIDSQTIVAVSTALIRTREAEQRQRAAEERARKIETRASRVVESIADPVVAFDKDFRYTYVSRRAAQVLGKEPEEMLGRSMWDLFPGGINTGFEEACRRVWNEGKPVTVERYSHVLGVWVESYIYPLENGASVQWREVTERKRAEEALRKSEQRSLTFRKQPRRRVSDVR